MPFGIYQIPKRTASDLDRRADEADEECKRCAIYIYIYEYIGDIHITIYMYIYIYTYIYIGL